MPFAKLLTNDNGRFSSTNAYHSSLAILESISRSYLICFTQIGDVLPRFQIYEHLFAKHELVVQALSDVYVDIISFCSAAKCVFRQGKRQVITNLKIFGKLTWKPFERQFGDFMALFRRKTQNVEQSAGVSHMIEAAEARHMTREHQMQVQKMQDEECMEKMLAILSNGSYEHRQRTLRAVRHEGTCDWFIRNHKYQNWKKAQYSTKLVVTGIPGCGKSVLFSHVIDDLLYCRPIGRESPALIYYFFDFADQQSLRLDQFLGSMMRQLLLSRSMPPQLVASLLEVSRNGLKMPDIDLLRQFLLSTIETLPETFLVVDGVDECERMTVEYLLRLISDINAVQEPHVKILVSCRTEEGLVQNLGSHGNVMLSQQILTEDLKSYIRHEVAEKLESKALRMENAVLAEEIVRELTTRSQGMFLWVFFQIQELCEATSDFTIREVLRDLPRDLGETYERILMRILRNKQQTDLVQRVFGWLYCGKRLLTVSEMQEAVAFDTWDGRWTDEKIPSEAALIGACRGLVTRDPSNDTIHFAHHTVREYFSRREQAKDFKIISGDDYAGDFCITYLTFSDFETAVIRRPNEVKMQPTGILGPGGPGSIPRMLGLGGPVFDVTQRLFQGRLKPRGIEIDWATYLQIKQKPIVPDVYSKYTMLSYVTEYWLEHTKSMPESAMLHQKLINLATQRSFAFDILPWGANRHVGPYGCLACPPMQKDEFDEKTLRLTSMFHWAAQTGHITLLKMISKPYVSHERDHLQIFKLSCFNGQSKAFAVLLHLFDFHALQHISSEKLFRITCESGSSDCLRVLLRNADRLDVGPAELTDWLYTAATKGYADSVHQLAILGGDSCLVRHIDGEVPMHSAVREGHEDVVQELLLLNEGRDLVIKSQLNGYTALHEAAKHNRSAMIKAMLDHVPLLGLEARDNQGQTALMKASMLGHASTVKVLLDVGAKVNTIYSRQIDGVFSTSFSAISNAAEQGHLDVLKLLGQDQQAIDDLGHKAIHCALENLHVETVKLLVESGAVVDRRALHIAAGSEQAECLKVLLDSLPLEKKASWISEQSSPTMAVSTVHGDTFLHSAARVGNMEGVSMLIANGADAEKLNIHQQSPLFLAVKSGSATTVENMLRACNAYPAADYKNSDSVVHRSPLACAAHDARDDMLKLLIPSIPDAMFVFEIELASQHAAGHDSKLRILEENIKTMARERATRKLQTHG